MFNILYTNSYKSSPTGAFFPLETSPLMVSLVSPALDLTVIVLLKAPGRPVALYVALTTPVLPGATGVFVHSGVVQPQLAFTSCSNRILFLQVEKFYLHI